MSIWLLAEKTTAVENIVPSYNTTNNVRYKSVPLVKEEDCQDSPEYPWTNRYCVKIRKWALYRW